MNEPTPKVYAAISAVSRALATCGIAKTRQNRQQGFAFRGIDDVYASLAPVLTAHELVIVPRYISRAVTEQESRSGGTLFHVCLEAEFDFVCSTDGSKHTARVFGEAMDSGDKATAKAMSACYKALSFQLFCIPTEGDNDPDYASPSVAGRAPSQQPPAKAPAARMLPDEAEAAERRVDEAFAGRCLLGRAEQIKSALLRKMGVASLADAGPEFVDRLVANIESGIYDNINGASRVNGNPRSS